LKKNIKNVVSVAAGILFNLSLKKDGSLWVWGWNNFSQFGVDTSSEQILTPQKIMDGAFNSIESGSNKNFAIKDDGSIWFWEGSNKPTAVELKNAPVQNGSDIASNPAPDSDSIRFSNPIIEAETRRLCKKATGDIYKLDLEKIIALTLENKNINDISDLKWFTCLEFLSLNNNMISEIKPLSNLTKLKTLYVNQNNLSDISALSELVNLTQLELSYNKIADISALGKLTNLKSIYIDENSIIDISPLKALASLQTLMISRNQLKDIQH